MDDFNGQINNESKISKYGFNVEWSDHVIKFLGKVNEDSFWKANWAELKVVYDAQEDKFIASNLLIKRTIPDDDVYRALNLLIESLNAEANKEMLLEKYADALNYFHHRPLIDDHGLFIKTGLFQKKYFTLAELDEMNKRYLKIKK